MNSKYFLENKQKQLISGNRTKTNPQKDIVAYYQGYAMTAFNESNQTPEDMVINAKDFVDENHK